MDRVKECFRKTGSVEEALKVRGILPPHEVLRICAEEKLKRMGYKIIKYEEAPEWIKATGSPDIIAVKDNEYILAEVKPGNQLKRYTKTTKAKFILITDIDEGKAVEVWGRKELDIKELPKEP
jgi:hypothetical protein